MAMNRQTHLAKHGCEQDRRDITTPLEHTHPTPDYFQKDKWHSMQETPNKGPIRHLGKHIPKHDKGHNLANIENQTYQPRKWLKNRDIDEALANDFQTNSAVTWTIKRRA